MSRNRRKNGRQRTSKEIIPNSQKLLRNQKFPKANMKYDQQKRHSTRSHSDQDLETRAIFFPSCPRCCPTVQEGKKTEGQQKP